MEIQGDSGRSATTEVEADEVTVDESARDDVGIEEDARATTRDDRFLFLAQYFGDAIEALRETHDELSPAASELDSVVHIWDETFEGSKRLTVDDRELLATVFRDVGEGGLTSHEVVDRLWEAVKDTHWGPQFAFDFVRRAFRPRRQPIFHNAILISVVAAFESHLAKLADEYYRAAPDALHRLPKEAVKEFSLRELQSMGSIEDAIEMAIEQRVTALMFGSLADWKKFFAERMNIDLASLSGDWGSIQEVFERRHCIVHSEAKASRRYIRNYPNVELRDPLNADGDYVRQAMESLELLGLLLHTAVWSKFALDRQEIIDSIESRGFASLKEARWQFSLRIYESWQTLPLSEAEQRMAKVNLWIARKNLNGLESIRSEVDSWDVSGSDELYAFAKLCLLDELDGAFAMLPVMVERDKVAGMALATWPLLAPLREDPRIQRYADIMGDYLSDEADNSVGDAGNVERTGRLDLATESNPDTIPASADDATSDGTKESVPPAAAQAIGEGLESETIDV
ncbi:hypothetical protein QN355_13105 [Cryobacterium sp. 10S3]|uniref:hypothetical protein n=1 Tax=Cryobacterium sp. 10S3 TaxID=3048582 RepID=UPI002AC89CA3|nr:hypothetical protein [Cryobacterium sp. 10S3]MEB0287490.1 hypothetical protein [Cryobacterium sp. 10S3]WPX13286.1 hypothetical protein RHM57_16685 [Cryobacterium sp. 10S3]